MIKVLSLKEPFASLIKEGIKKVETRSWQTSYRGELYIHASISRSSINEKNTEFQKLIKDLEYQP
ncbi:MAG: ASCH domain-containing protein, partial [Erysipelotrichaceae bacterium]|nr:ASCH domain-containing protein [Erysipelotrichaceae bacterium]